MLAFSIIFAMAVTMVVASSLTIAAPSSDTAVEKENGAIEEPTESIGLLVPDEWTGNAHGTNPREQRTEDILPAVSMRYVLS